MATDLEILFSKKAEELTTEDVQEICKELRSKREQFAIVEAKKSAPKEAKQVKEKKTKEEELLASTKLSLDDLL